MKSETHKQIGGLFKSPKISVLPEKCIFTDFNKIFLHNFLLCQTMRPILHGSIIFKKIYFVYSQRKVKSAFFSFLREHMVFFLGEMNGKFVQISRFNMRNFAAKRREISRRNSVLVGEKSKALFTFSRRFSAKYSTQY